MGFLKLLLTFVMVTFLNLSFADGHGVKLKGDFGWFAVTGLMMPINDGHIYWSGEFSGTYFADDTKSPLHEAAVRCPGYNDVRIAEDKSDLAGYCIFQDASGDQATLHWSGGGKANGAGGEMKWISGTGKYANLSGPAGKWRGFTMANWKDGYANGWAYWNK